MRICTPRCTEQTLRAQFFLTLCRPLFAIGNDAFWRISLFLWSFRSLTHQDYTVRPLAKELLTSPALVGLEVLAHAEWSIAIFESLWLIALVISSAMNRRVSHFKPQYEEMNNLPYKKYPQVISGSWYVHPSSAVTRNRFSAASPFHVLSSPRRTVTAASAPLKPKVFCMTAKGSFAKLRIKLKPDHFLHHFDGPMMSNEMLGLSVACRRLRHCIPGTLAEPHWPQT